VTIGVAMFAFSHRVCRSSLHQSTLPRALRWSRILQWTSKHRVHILTFTYTYGGLATATSCNIVTLLSFHCQSRLQFQDLYVKNPLTYVNFLQSIQSVSGLD